MYRRAKMKFSIPKEVMEKIDNKVDLYLLWKLWIMADDHGYLRFSTLQDLSNKLGYVYPYMLNLMKKLHDKGLIYKTRGLIQMS